MHATYKRNSRTAHPIHATTLQQCHQRAKSYCVEGRKRQYFMFMKKSKETYVYIALEFHHYENFAQLSNGIQNILPSLFIASDTCYVVYEESIRGNVNRKLNVT